MIHCIGNSHVNNFSNHEKLSFESKDSRFKLHHIGPVIAYNFAEHHYHKVDNIISSIDKTTDWVTLVAGEVDCRLHLPLQADNQQRSDESIVEECVDRFFVNYVTLKSAGYNVFCTGTHPTTIEPHDMSRHDRPIYGDVARRNNICLLWENELKRQCINADIPFVSVYDHLVDENNITKMDFFIDYCHLNSEKIFEKLILELKKHEILK